MLNLVRSSLAFVPDALAKTRLGVDSYRLLVLGLDPKDGAAEATRFRKAQADLPGLPIVMLSAPEATVKAATAAVGYRYVYNAARDQYAHPVAVLASRSTASSPAAPRTGARAVMADLACSEN